MAVFETEVDIQAPVEELFDFLIQPINIKAISPPEMGLKFLETPERYSNGCEVRFAVQTMGQIQEFTHRITHFDEPNLFVEELIAGPLPLWKHSHHFTAIETGSTNIRDVIEFKPPGGLIGLMMSEDRILESLEDGFYYRHQQLKNSFPGDDSSF